MTHGQPQTIEEVEAQRDEITANYERMKHERDKLTGLLYAERVTPSIPTMRVDAVLTTELCDAVAERDAARAALQRVTDIAKDHPINPTVLIHEVERAHMRGRNAMASDVRAALVGEGEPE